MSLLSFNESPSLPPAAPGANEALPDAARLMAVLEGAGLGVWSWNLADTEQWSTGTSKLFGFVAEQMPAGTRYLQRVVEEDRTPVEAQFRSVISDKTTSFTVRHRVRWPDSSIHWIELIGQRQIDTCGQAMLVVWYAMSPPSISRHRNWKTVRSASAWR